MTNYILNILLCDNTDILNNLLNSENNVDFNKIIKMPDYIKNTVCGSVVEFIDDSVNNREEREKTRRPLNEKDKLGANEGWYNWSLRNWGTKWNAKDTKILHPNVIFFITAWNPPYEVLKALSLMHPDYILNLYYKDELIDGVFEYAEFLNGVKK